MILHLKEACSECRMCELGRSRGGFDSHVFSDHDPTCSSPQFMIVDQKPGWTEVKKGRPFVLCDKVEDEIFWDRTDFYITNAIKCYVEKPTLEHAKKCEPFLRMEIAIFKPKLVVTFGDLAFNSLCDEKFSESIGKITKSKKFGVKVFTTYRPTIENMARPAKRKQFTRDIKTLGKIMTKYLTPF